VALNFRRLHVLALGLGTVAAFAATAGAASAAARPHTALGIACPDPTSTPFARWGDTSSYAFAPDGGVEDGAAGWTLTGAAQVAPGSEPFAVSGPGTSSLSLLAGSSATSPPMCIGFGSFKMRFFAANAGAARSKLHVQVVYGGGVGSLLGALGGTLGVSDAGTITRVGAWHPTPAITMLGGVLPLFTQYVQFRFTPVDKTGSWRIDDVYLDPLRHR
jgi:hypothetical protein